MKLLLRAQSRGRRTPLLPPRPVVIPRWPGILRLRHGRLGNRHALKARDLCLPIAGVADLATVAAAVGARRFPLSTTRLAGPFVLAAPSAPAAPPDPRPRAVPTKDVPGATAFGTRHSPGSPARGAVAALAKKDRFGIPIVFGNALIAASEEAHPEEEPGFSHGTLSGKSRRHSPIAIPYFRC